MGEAESSNVHVPVLSLSGDAQLLELSLHGGKGLGGSCIENELRLGKFVEILEGLGL